MGDYPRRLIILATIVALAVAASWGMGRRSGRYGLLDFLRGRPAPMFAPEQYTLPDAPALATADVPLLARLNDEYAKLTAAVVPSVVSVDTSETVAVQSGFPGSYRQYQRPGLGSGVIVTPEGHIITNHHVVANKDAIRVTLTTAEGKRESYAADLIGSLASYDIAVLRIRSDRRNFPALKIGDSSKVRVGQLALAIGNPYGLAESVTQGIISAVDRRISDAGPSYFQTDTPINPGNSGGPLVNFQGEIIGINSVVLRGPEADRAAQNIGFAIPSSQAWEAFEIITGRGRQVFAYLGVGLGDVTPQVAEALHMPGLQGAWVQSLVAGGPAALAGLRAPEVFQGPSGEAKVRPPDVILKLNDKPVTTGEGLVAQIRRMAPGTVVKLIIWRDGKELEVPATLGDSSSLPRVQAAAENPKDANAPPDLGTLAQGRAVLNSVGITCGTMTSGPGARVDAVRPGALAEGKIQPGDLILSVNGSMISSPAEFNRAVLAAARNRAGLTLKISRDGDEREVVLAHP